MKHRIDLQQAYEGSLPVGKSVLISWANLVLKEEIKPVELTLRLVELEEISQLNQSYRKKEGPTNVLAFPSHLPSSIKLKYRFLGDVILCPQILEEEALSQSCSIEAHWAHIVIHGILHLLGHDHQEEEEERLMQTEEIRLLAQLGFSNPYA